MFLSKFYARIILRVILIVLTSLVIGFEVLLDRHWLYAFFLVFVLLFQTILLIRYVNKTNEKLSNFIRHINLGDTSVTFSERSESESFSKLNKSFNSIIEQIKKIKLEKATQAQILQTIIEQVDIGLIAQNSSGKIRFINRSAQELLQVGQGLKNIHGLDMYYPGISTFLQKIQVHEPKLKTLRISDELTPISFKVSIIRLPDEEVRFYIFQNIKAELDEQELDSWQKLIRVLTHEIMNSIAPITTLSHTINMLFSQNGHQRNLEEIDREMITDALSCTELIEERSKGLMQFVQQYRRLTQTFELAITEFSVKEFLEQNLNFLKAGIDVPINFVIEVEPESLLLEADRKLIEQVIINLMKNAAEAVAGQENPLIRLVGCENSRGRKEIHVIDNGQGIEEEEIEKIFVPFYTTKPEGNGIGLSLSKQIMQQHGGTISVKSILNQQTVFKLTF